jgi:hypothetical protein
MEEPQIRKFQVCDRWGGRFGMVRHRWWGHKFCKRECKDAHPREVSLGREAIARWRMATGLAATLMLSAVNAQCAKSNGAHAIQFTKATTSKPARHAELKVHRRSAESGTTRVPTPARWISETTAIALPETDQFAGTRPLAGPVVPITPERIIESDELLGANANDVSFDGLANKVMVQGEAISAPPGRADHVAWRQPDFDSARGAPELAQTEPPRISIVAEKDVPSSNDGRANGTAAVTILQTLKLWIGQVADQIAEKVIRHH